MLHKEPKKPVMLFAIRFIHQWIRSRKSALLREYSRICRGILKTDEYRSLFG